VRRPSCAARAAWKGQWRHRCCSATDAGAVRARRSCCGRRLDVVRSGRHVGATETSHEKQRVLASADTIPGSPWYRKALRSALAAEHSPPGSSITPHVGCVCWAAAASDVERIGMRVERQTVDMSGFSGSRRCVSRDPGQAATRTATSARSRSADSEVLEGAARRASAP
jgi:hypothetical protein